MRQYSSRQFREIVKYNGFQYVRHSGDHYIYINNDGKHISIPETLKSVIALRLIKENNLITDIKQLKKNKKYEQ